MVNAILAQVKYDDSFIHIEDERTALQVAWGGAGNGSGAMLVEDRLGASDKAARVVWGLVRLSCQQLAVRPMGLGLGSAASLCQNMGGVVPKGGALNGSNGMLHVAFTPCQLHVVDKAFPLSRREPVNFSGPPFPTAVQMKIREESPVDRDLLSQLLMQLRHSFRWAFRSQSALSLDDLEKLVRRLFANLIINDCLVVATYIWFVANDTGKIYSCGASKRKGRDLQGVSQLDPAGLFRSVEAAANRKVYCVAQDHYVPVADLKKKGHSNWYCPTCQNKFVRNTFAMGDWSQAGNVEEARLHRAGFPRQMVKRYLGADETDEEDVMMEMWHHVAGEVFHRGLRAGLESVGFRQHAIDEYCQLDEDGRGDDALYWLWLIMTAPKPGKAPANSVAKWTLQPQQANGFLAGPNRAINGVFIDAGTDDMFDNQWQAAMSGLSPEAWFHGCTEWGAPGARGGAASVARRIRVQSGMPVSDLGRGFYLSNSPLGALAFAIDKVLRLIRGDTSYAFVEPALLVYERLPTEGPPPDRCLTRAHIVGGEEWVWNIFYNRSNALTADAMEEFLEEIFESHDEYEGRRRSSCILVGGVSTAPMRAIQVLNSRVGWAAAEVCDWVNQHHKCETTQAVIQHSEVAREMDALLVRVILFRLPVAYASQLSRRLRSGGA